MSCNIGTDLLVCVAVTVEEAIDQLAKQRK